MNSAFGLNDAEITARAHQGLELAVMTAGEVEVFEVRTVEDYTAGAGLISKVRKRLDEVDELEKSLTRPLNDTIKRIRELFAPAKEKLKLLDQTLSTRLLLWKKRKDQERAEAEAKARQQAEAERAKLEKRADRLEARGKEIEAQAVRNIASVAPMPVVESVVPKVAGMTTRENWTWRVVDEALVPREYLKLDEAKITRVVKALKKEARIPGIEAYAEEGLSRTGR